MNEGASPSVELLLPVYNERERLPRVLDEVHAWTAARAWVRVLVVDDGSSDGSGAFVRSWLEAHSDARIGLHCCGARRGKGGALREAVLRSEAALVCFTDGDLAYSLDHVDRLVIALADYDLVLGSRALASQKQVNIRLRRKVLGAAFNRFVRVYLGLPYRDTQAGLKGFRGPVAKTLFAQCHHTGFAFDVELLYLASLHRLRVGEIPAFVSPTHSYKVSSVHLRRDPWQMLWAVLRMRWQHGALR